MSDIVRNHNSESSDGTVVGYMCLIDWEWELGAAADGNKVFPSVDALKQEHDCWQGCGIVEVRVSFSKVIEPEGDHSAEFATPEPQTP